MKFMMNPSIRSRAALLAGLVSLVHLVAPAPARAADVLSVSVAKGILFTQTNTSAPQLKTGLPYLFQAAAVPASNGLNAASMGWVFGNRALTQRLPGGPFTFTDRQPSAGLLDIFYPHLPPNNGYIISMNTVNDGFPSVLLNMPDGVNPNAPFIIGFNTTQSINPSNDFILRWSPFTDGTSNDFVHVRIDSPTGVVFRTAYGPGAPGALNGTNGTVLIPSNSLPAGKILSARVVFGKVLTTNVTDYPGVTGAAMWYTQTEFLMRTTGAGDSTPPQVAIALPPNGATSVPVNHPFGLTFSETMRQSFSFFLSGSTAGRAFNWSPDLTVLVSTPVTNWGANLTLGWVLNPSDGLPLIADAASNPLAPETTFLFTTGTNSAPAAAPQLTQPTRLVDGRFRITVLGESNRTYAVQASTNLTNWTALATNIAFHGSFNFTDTNAPALPRRFYRGVAP